MMHGQKNSKDFDKFGIHGLHRRHCTGYNFYSSRSSINGTLRVDEIELYSCIKLA